MNRTHVITDLWNKDTTILFADWYLDHTEADYSKFDKRELEQFINRVYTAEQNKGIEPRLVIGQPYNTADEMRIDYKQGYLNISTDYNNPALISPISNLEFRFAHDCHHSQTENCNFQLWGECCAYSKFAAYTNDLRLRRWLFSEIVLQVCALIKLKEFAAQKHLFAPRRWVAIVDNAYGLTPCAE